MDSSVSAKDEILVSARVPSHFKRSLTLSKYTLFPGLGGDADKEPLLVYKILRLRSFLVLLLVTCKKNVKMVKCIGFG